MASLIRPAFRRPLRTLLFAVMAAALWAPSASMATEAPRAPALLGTTPSSPGRPTALLVFGTAQESVTLVADPGQGLARGGPFAAVAGEEETITIYADAACTGEKLESGGVAEFESVGIPVEVPL